MTETQRADKGLEEIKVNDVEMFCGGHSGKAGLQRVLALEATACVQTQASHQTSNLCF